MVVIQVDPQGNEIEAYGLTKLLDYTGGPGDSPVYVGFAQPLDGAATATPTDEARWKIMRLTYDGDNVTAVEWAGGTTEFDKIWDDRATLDYA